MCLLYCSPAPPERMVPPRYSIAILHKEPGSTTSAGIFSAASPGGFFPSVVVPPSAGRATAKLPGGVGGELPAPALRLAVSPSFRGGPGLDREGVTCQPVRWGRQRWAKGRDDTFPQAPSAARGEVSQPRRQRGSHRLTGGSEGPGRVWSRRGPSPPRRR